MLCLLTSPTFISRHSRQLSCNKHGYFCWHGQLRATVRLPRFFFAVFNRVCLAMDSFRSSHVEHSYSHPPRSDSSGADLVVERPLIRPVDFLGRPQIYNEPETSSSKISLESQFSSHSQNVTSHPVGLGPNSFSERTRGDVDIGFGGDRAQNQGAPSVLQRVAGHELPRPHSTILSPRPRPTMRFVHMTTDSITIFGLI